jgi:Protein of unknown function (DUF2569)
MPHPDLNQLLDSFLLPLAERLLAERGEFLPFGGTMSQAGEVVAVGAADGKEPASSQNVVEVMTKALRLRTRNGQLRAVGICYDGRTVPPGQTEKCDAVCVGVEHQSGEAVNLILPYRRTGKGDVQYGEKFTTIRVPQFFVPNELPFGGWLLVLCLVLVFWYPAISLIYIFRNTIPNLVDSHVPIRALVLLSVYAVLFIPVAVFSLVAGLRLWMVKRGAVNFAKRFLWTYLGANIGYFVIWVLWTLIAQPSASVNFAEMGWGHVVGPVLFVALWYSYLERSKRVRDTYVS